MRLPNRLRRSAAAIALGLVLVGAAALLAGGCAAPERLPETAEPGTAERLLIVAVADGPQARPAAGSTGRGAYRTGAGYAGSDAAQALAEDVAGDYHLSEVSAWTIDPLRLRCMLYRMRDGDDREALLRRLAADARVRLAQPLQHFDTYTGATPAPTAASAASMSASAGGPSPVPAGAPTGAYNDPYFALQRGLARMGVEAAQRLTQGAGVRVAVIDTLVDAAHPDLDSRVVAQRDFARGAAPSTAERHGTEVAGIIAAAANNGIGIVGVAPQARILSYRACWALPAPARGARCDTFSLAQALAQALADRADIINLSLGGPADPLLQSLVETALQRGAIVVGALPPSGRREGFPTGLPGVVAAAMAEAGPPPPGTLAAPGQEVITLERAGGYDFASGSSLAAAHVSGAMALLRALDPQLAAPRAESLLRPAAGARAAPIDLCGALRGLRPGLACAPGA